MTQILEPIQVEGPDGAPEPVPERWRQGGHDPPWSRPVRVHLQPARALPAGHARHPHGRPGRKLTRPEGPSARVNRPVVVPPGVSRSEGWAWELATYVVVKCHV